MADRESRLPVNVSPLSWNSIWRPRLIALLQVEQRLVFAGVIICALFAVVKPDAPLLFIAICLLVVGNLMYFVQVAPGRLYKQLAFPWNWAVFLPVVTAGSFVGALASVALLRLLRPQTPPYWILFRESWLIVMVVSVSTGVAGFTVAQLQRKLQEKNRQLEQAVQRSNTELVQQDQELQRALEIQRGLLPKQLLQLPGIGLAGVWLPARTVGGDYFDVIPLDEHRLGICVGDVSGKGLTASLLMANLQAAFRAYAIAGASPAQVCAKLNNFMCGNVAPGKFITFFYGILDARRRQLVYESAGHCPGILLQPDGTYELLAGHGGVLGVVPEWTYADTTVELVPGHRLLLFTDGITEAEDRQSAEFGNERIALAAGPFGATSDETKRRILESVTNFCNNEFRDDVTLLVATIH